MCYDTDQDGENRLGVDKLKKYRRFNQKFAKKKQKNDGCLMLLIKNILFFSAITLILYWLIQVESFTTNWQFQTYAHQDSLLFVKSHSTVSRTLLLFFTAFAVTILFLF